MELVTFLRILLKKWWLILPIFVLTLAATIFLTARQQPVYEARATYVVTLNTLLIDDNNFVSALDILSRRTEISTTYAEIAQSRRVRTLAANGLNLSVQSLEELSVEARLIPGTNLLELSVLANDRVLAMDFVDAIGETTQSYVEQLYEVYELTQLDPPVVSSTPVQPKPLINLLLGSVVGLTLGASTALLAAYLTHRPDPDPTHTAGTEPQADSASSNGVLLHKLQRDVNFLERQLTAHMQVLEQVKEISYQTHSVVLTTNEALQTLTEHTTPEVDGVVPPHSQNTLPIDHV